jgi:hypothetical protein
MIELEAQRSGLLPDSDTHRTERRRKIRTFKLRPVGVPDIERLVAEIRPGRAGELGMPQAHQRRKAASGPRWRNLQQKARQMQRNAAHRAPGHTARHRLSPTEQKSGARYGRGHGADGRPADRAFRCCLTIHIRSPKWFGKLLTLCVCQPYLRYRPTAGSLSLENPRQRARP